MKKFLLLTCGIISIVATVIIVLNLNFVDTDKTALADNHKKELTIIPINEELIKDNIAFKNITAGIYEFDMSNYEITSDYADCIIIGTVESIDGVVNVNPSTKEYVMTRTVGRIKVDQVLKGNLNEKVIPFIRLGGTLPLSEYEKELPEAHAKKMGLDKLSQTEKESKYVEDVMYEDIEIENGTTYLMFISYSSDYERYVVMFNEYGLREFEKDNAIGVQSINSTGIMNIKIRDNKTGEYETLGEVLPNIIKNNSEKQ